jgi:NADP-dependent 3-hydroxy acid dehydrogenase YdfG
MQLKGAVAVVTGASAGIGEATAVALSQHGAKVVLAARRLDRLESMAERITRAGGTALAVPCDVTDHRELQTLRGVVLEAFGPVDVLVNNAGIPGGGELATLDYEQIRKVVEVNVLGVMFGTRAFLPGMLARGHGHIVNVASLAGRFATPGASVYTASKHAVVAFSESLNITTRPQGVLVTAVNPAFVTTEGFTAEGRPGFVSLTTVKVADAIVHVVQRGIAPEFSIPRWAGPLGTLSVLMPRLYGRVVELATRRYR